MAGTVEDPKVVALRAQRCLNPHPQRVRDETFLGAEFFDARDAVQVKYEMVRRVQVDRVPVSAAAASFGYSRPSYYAAAAALQGAGLEGLVPAKPGPRRGHKLTEQILTWAVQRLADDPELRPAGLADPIEEAFGVRVHPRSIERALARYRKQSKAATDPSIPERGEEDPAPLPLTPSPGRVAADADEPRLAPPVGRVPAPGSGLDARYEQLRHAALHARADAIPLGLAVLTGRGVTAWRRALADLSNPATTAPATMPTTSASSPDMPTAASNFSPCPPPCNGAPSTSSAPPSRSACSSHYRPRPPRQDRRSARLPPDQDHGTSD